MGFSLWTILVLLLCSPRMVHGVHMKSCVAHEGKEATIVCLVPKTEENKDLWWTERDMSTGASTPLSKCPLTNFHQLLCEDEESARSKYHTEIFIHGDEFRIALKIPAVSAHQRQLEFTCKVHKTKSNISRDSETCHLLVIHPPNKPSCSAEHKHGKIRVTCKTDKVYPNLACQMVRKVTNEANVTTDVRITMATVNEPIDHNGFSYNNATCSASIDPGNSDVQVYMYPNAFPFEELASIGAEFITKIQVPLLDISQETNNDTGSRDQETVPTTNSTATPEISSNTTMHWNEKSDVNDTDYNRAGMEEGKANAGKGNAGKANAVLAAPACDNAALIAMSVLLAVSLIILVPLSAWFIRTKIMIFKHSESYTIDHDRNHERRETVRHEGSSQQQQRHQGESTALISPTPNAPVHQPQRIALQNRGRPANGSNAPDGWSKAQSRQGSTAPNGGRPPPERHSSAQDGYLEPDDGQYYRNSNETAVKHVF